ncbi:uncharacterized protein LOC141913993 [Tubulanus polymorphus]|uniref:uncharacterized protein LOC141913993 n=1 Tax=Tubulanus polymorphus TaxID=672921 RepID=UPI003DA38C1B
MQIYATGVKNGDKMMSSSKNCRCKVSRDVGTNPKYGSGSLAEARPCTPCRCMVERDVVKSRSLQSIPKGELIDGYTQTTPSIEGDDTNYDLSDLIFSEEPPNDTDVTYIDDKTGAMKLHRKAGTRIPNTVSDGYTSGYASSLGTYKDKSDIDSLLKPDIRVTDYTTPSNTRSYGSGNPSATRMSYLSPDYVPNETTNGHYTDPYKISNTSISATDRYLNKSSDSKPYSSDRNLNKDYGSNYGNAYTGPSCHDYLKAYNLDGTEPKYNYKLKDSLSPRNVHYASDDLANQSRYVGTSSRLRPASSMPDLSPRDARSYSGIPDVGISGYSSNASLSSPPKYGYVRGISSLYEPVKQRHSQPDRSNSAYTRSSPTGRPPIPRRPPSTPSSRIPAKYDISSKTFLGKPSIPNYSRPTNYRFPTRTNYSSDSYQPPRSPSPSPHSYDGYRSQPGYKSTLSRPYESDYDLASRYTPKTVPTGSYIGPSKWRSVPDLHSDGIFNILTTSNAWLHKIQDTLDAGTQTKPGTTNGHYRERVVTPSTSLPRNTRPKYGSCTMPRTYATTQTENSTSLPPQSVDNDNINELKELFDILDRNKDGKLTRTEINAAKPSLVYKANRRFLEDILDCLRMTHKTYITFAELMRFYLTSARHLAEEYRAIQKTFKWLDPTGKGFIGENDLRYLAAEHGIFLTSRATRQVIREADIDQDGVVTFDDFVYIMLKAKLTGDED